MLTQNRKLPITVDGTEISIGKYAIPGPDLHRLAGNEAGKRVSSLLHRNNIPAVDPVNRVRYLGLRFNEMYQQLQHQVWIEPYEGVIEHFCKNDNQWSATLIQCFHDAAEHIMTAANDGLLHLVPMIMYFNRPPQLIKRIIGKSLWRRLSHKCIDWHKALFNDVWAHHPGKREAQTERADWHLRSKSHDHGYIRDFYFRKDWIIQLAEARLILPDDFIAHKIPIGTLENYCWAARTLHTESTDKSFQGWRELMALVDDTGRLFGEKQQINYQWSKCRMKREHDQKLREHLERSEAHHFEEYLSEHDGREFNFDSRWIRELGFGDYRVKLLTTAKAIYREGQAMQHCVAEYIDDVHAGHYLVYSVAAPSERTTLGISICEHSGTATVDQHSGVHNAPVKGDKYASLYQQLCVAEQR